MGVLSGRRGSSISPSSSDRETRLPSFRPLFEQLEHRWVLSAAALADATDLVANSTAGNTSSQAASEAAAGNSIDAFALDLYAQLQGTNGGNLFVSPFSIATALAMTYAGARGETAQQMASVLHFGDPNSTESDFGALLGDLNAAGQSGGYLLSAANALWVQQGLDILPEFLNAMQNDFDGGLNQADFINAAEAARQTINDWVAQQTHGKITDLLPPGSLDKATRFVLANAVYLKAPWSSPFNPSQTSDAPFTLASGSQVTASMMNQTGEFRYMESDGFQVVELPYANGRLAMDVLLPTQSGLAGLGSNQLPADLNGWLQGLSTQRVAISLPKFEMTTSFQLSSPLEALGMTDAFDPTADFSGITASEQVMLSQVYHKAFISVDEAGTEAAAATAVVGIDALSVFDPGMPISFNADHPFLFLIRDTQSGTVLFMGQVEDPTQQGSDSSAPVITQQPRSADPVIRNPAPQNPVTQNPVQQPISVTLPIEIMGPVAPPTPPRTASSLTANEKLVDAMYESLLDRAAEPAALAFWSQLLDGGASRASVADQIEAGNEYRQDEVESLYQHYLGRAADAGGLAYFTAKLAAGGTVEKVAAALAGSTEFAQSNGGTSNLVDALFTTIMGRSVDAGSLTLFQQELAAGAGGSQLASQILASDEYQRQLAGTLLTHFLDRPADSSGVGHFAAALHAGATDEQVAGDILASDEFFAKAANA